MDHFRTHDLLAAFRLLQVADSVGIDLACTSHHKPQAMTLSSYECCFRLCQHIFRLSRTDFQQHSSATE